MTPVPQRNIDTFGGGSIPKNPDPVAALKERLKQEVINENTNIWQRLPPVSAALADRYCKWFLTLIDETK